MHEEARKVWRERILAQVAKELDAMEDEALQFLENPNAVSFLNLEKNVNAILDRAGDKIAMKLAQEVLTDPQRQVKAVSDRKKNIVSTTGDDESASSSAMAESST